MLKTKLLLLLTFFPPQTFSPSLPLLRKWDLHPPCRSVVEVILNHFCVHIPHFYLQNITRNCPHMTSSSTTSTFPSSGISAVTPEIFSLLPHSTQNFHTEASEIRAEYKSAHVTLLFKTFQWFSTLLRVKVKH